MGAPAEQVDELLTFGTPERAAIFYPKSDLRVPDSTFRALKAQAEDALQERLPALRKLAVQLGFKATVTPLAAGSFHVVHRIGRDDRDFVVRSTLPGLFAQDRSLLFDRSVRAWLAPLGLADLVPRTEAVQFRADGAPFDLAVLEFARGTVLRDLGDAILDEEPAYLNALGEALRALHAVAGAGAGLLDCSEDSPRAAVGIHGSWQNYLQLRLEDHIRACAQAGYVDHPLAERILRLFDIMRPQVLQRPLHLLHGDLGTHNVCIDPKSRKVTAVLDFEDAMVGDPLFDVAMVSSFQPERRLAPFLAGYGLPNPTEEQQALISLYFLRIALSKTTHRLRFGIADRPDRTPGHHRIYRGVDELNRLV